MVAQHVELGEGAGVSLPTISTADLQSIIEASPAVVRLLPRLMRTMADEIEKVSRAHAANTANAANTASSSIDISQCCRSADDEAVARQVVTELSATLSRHLALGHGLDASETTHSLAANASADHPHSSMMRPSTPRNGESLTVPSLRLKLLGTPEIMLNGVRVKALERCNRASLIIYILALHPRGLSVERLAAYIVSDSADFDAFDTDATMRLGAVRTFIWRLRKLARWRDIVVSPAEQGAYQNRYRLPDNATCDLWEFENSLDQAARLAVRASIEPGAADRAAVLRQDAILLYNGEFCKGIGAGTIANAAGYLRHRYLQAISLQAAYWKERAMKLHEARKDGIEGVPTVEEENAWLEALSNYRLAARVEPYEESFYAAAVLCQAHLGQRRSVQITLARWSQVVNTELEG